MSLMVGELVGFIRLDDGEVRPALTRTEGALNAAGARMANSADATGTRTGQALGDGITRGADGRLRNAQGQFVAAGRVAGDGFGDGAAAGARSGLTRLTTVAGSAGNRAGDALGDGLRQGAADGADDAVQAAEGGLSRMQMIAAGAGVAAGGALLVGITEALSQAQITSRLGAQLGATPPVAQRYGRIAGKMYADAVTEDFQGAADAISATMRAGLLPPSATNAQIQSISTNVSDLATTFELDLGQAANAVGQIMKTGLAPNAKTALDVITRGMQVMGPRADDIADTFNEYSTIFRQLGISAGDATGIMSQGLAAGARDTDVVADSLKELVLITQGGGDEVDKAFKKIGLSGSEMQNAFAKGGPASKAALDQIFDGLRKVKDPADRSALAVTLFGTKSEDMQKALFAIDPSGAVGALGETAGAADKAGNALRDNAGSSITQLQRKLTQGLVNTLNSYVLPVLNRFAKWAMENPGKIKLIALVITGVVVPAFVLMGVTATVAAARMVAGWVTTGAAAVTSAATQVAAGTRVVASWVLMSLRATMLALRVVAGWVMASAAAVAQAAIQVAAGARVAAVWVLMGVQSMIHAARMAAAWFIALGPVGWIIATVIALAALIWANWDKIKNATGVVWDWIWSKIKGIGSTILGYIRSMPLVSLFLNHWDRIKSGTVSKVLGFISYVRGIPGRIKSAFGSLGSLLYNQGRNVVQGLWNGIKGMGGWLRGQLISFAKSQIPGPIAKALGISSPSRVMADAVGRHIPSGIVKGIHAGTPALDRTMAGLVTPASVGFGGVGMPSGGSYGRGGRGSGPKVELIVRSDGGQTGDVLVGLLQGNIQAKGGNVQSVLGAN
ncbi:phage tail tape measure protein [Streptomyces niveus]|uniref:phage tail tape measure protein n=1 Tax=Streptomyces niveus TaxID=193462 RepID=UPI0034175F10